MDYVELQVTTNFSFLNGASHPEEYVEQAALYGYLKIAITGRNSFAGIVRAHVVQAPDKLTTSRRFNLTRSGRSKLTTTSRSKLTT